MLCRERVVTGQHAGKRVTDVHMLETGTGNGGFLGPQELLGVDALQPVAEVGYEGKREE